MPTSLDCPDIAFWRALFDDTLPPDRQDEWERHLESCSTCQERLDCAAEKDVALMTLARKVGDPTLAPIDATLADVLSELREQGSSTGVEPVDLYFLRRSDRRDLLGLLGDYEVTEVLGQGGMGTVLKAFDSSLRRWVAIKVMSAAIAGNATARKRFTREAYAAAAVSHENLVSVYSVHEADGLPYIVMQFVAGESLQDRLDGGEPLGLEEILSIGLQAARGLAAAHAKGLIHRDIKPANLLLEATNHGRGNGSEDEVTSGQIPHHTLPRVKIADFGLARTTDDTQLTQNGVVAGTPEYMSSEQARGDVVDHRADLFSLGGVLYAMCTGFSPFFGESTVAVLRQVCDATPTAIRATNPAIPLWLEEFIAHLMEKDPKDRFQSAAEVETLLEGFLVHVRQPAVVAPPSLPFANSVSKSTLRIRTRTWLIAAGLLGVILAFAMIGLWDNGEGAQEPDPSDGPRDELVCLFVNKNSGRCLSIGDGVDNPGARIIQGPTPDKAGPAERWRMLSAGKGYRLRNEASKLVLEIGSANMDRGVQAIHWHDHVTRTNQHWIFEKLDDGYVMHVGHNQFVLAIQQGSLDEGGQAIQWDFVPDVPDSRWEIVPVFQRIDVQFSKGLNQPLLSLVGNNAEAMVKTDAQGLHVNILADRASHDPVGVESTHRLQGDFDITLPYELLKVLQPAPAPASSAGVELRIRLESKKGATLTRMLGRKGNTVDANLIESGPDGIDAFQNILTTPANSKNGRLRLTRIGSRLAYHVADGDSAFKTVKEIDFGAEDVISVRAVCNSGIAAFPVEARMGNLDLQAVRFPEQPMRASPNAKGDGAADPKRRDWLFATLAVLLLAGACVVIVGGWFVVRSRRTTYRVGANVEPVMSVPSISFSCGECGKKLRAKPVSIDKKIKCPQCGKPVTVPRQG